MKQDSELHVEVEVTKLVGVLAAAFPNAHMSVESVKVYVAMLKDVPLDVLKLAVEQCIAESEFLPTIAKLRGQAVRLCSSTESLMEPLEAWALVKQQMGRVGCYRSPQFESPIIARAVQCMGWRELCSSENEVADRAHFSRLYQQLLEREIAEAKALPATREYRTRLNENDRQVPTITQRHVARQLESMVLEEDSLH